MRISRKLKLLAAVSTLLVLAAVPAEASPSDDGKPALPAPTGSDPGPPAIAAKARAQEPLVAAASHIQDVVDRGASAGFAGIVLDDDHVTVWWNGALPAPVRQAIRDARRTAPVVVAAAQHSRAELDAAADRIAADIRANPDGPYHSTKIAVDGSGVTVVADSEQPTAQVATMEQATGVPVDVEVGERPHTTGRLDDYAPYYAAGRIINNDVNRFCTAGWPVVEAGDYSILAAGHCGRPGGTWSNGNGTRYFGIGIDEVAAHDLLLIDASVAGRMWDGGVGSGEFTKGVAGADHTFPGEYVCTSGSVGGAKCWYQVTSEFQHMYCDDDLYNNYECYYDLVLANPLFSGSAADYGDSGGTVFSLVGADQSRVMAKGIISGVSSQGATDYLIFQDFITAQRDFGVSIVTG